MKEQNCPTCRRPKAAASRGSLTQWVTSCTCHLKLPDNPQAISIHFCRTCGKRIGEGRPGSFTQYIFRSDTCRCEFPEPGGTAVISTPPETARVEDDDSSDDETAIEIPQGRFPSDRYKPLAMLGQGSSGTVFLARDRLLRKKVAVKVLRGIAPEELIGFQDEARATSKLRHDGIVKLLDFGLIEDSIPYMVLEYVSGQSLEQILAQSGPIPWQRCVYIAQRLCATLEYAHQQGVFHRDIQPSNIIVTTEPDNSVGIRLIDFGIAKIVRDSIASAQSDSLALVGTPFYMSPDQGLGRKYDARSEVYSLGCVLFECLTGRPPFQGQTPLETLSMHAEQTPPKLPEAYQSRQPDTVSEQADFPESLQVLVERCLAKNPDERYQSMADMLSALEEFSRTFVRSSEEAALSRRARKPSLKRGVVPTIVICGLCLTGLLIASITGKHETDSKRGIGTAKSPKADKQQEMDTPRTQAIKDVGDAFVAKNSDHKGKPWKVSTTLFKNANWAREEFAGSPSTSKLTDIINTTATEVIVNGSFDDKYFSDLALYKNATLLDLSSNKLTDAGTAYIRSPKLRVLKLDNSLVKTMEFVSRLKSIEALTLTNTMVDNQAMARLCSLKNLKYIDITKTQVDDGAIQYLRKMPSLAELSSGKTLSKETIRQLAKEMPGCTFTFWGGKIAGFSDADIVRVVTTGTNSDAISYLSNCVSTIEKAQGKDSPQLVRFLAPLAGCYCKAQNLAASKAASERVIRICRDNDSSSTNLLTALTYRAQVAQKEKNFSDAVKYHREICTFVRKAYGISEALLSRTYSLACCMEENGDKEQAKQQFHAITEQARALSRKKKPLSPEDNARYVIPSWFALARMSYDTKDFGAAEEQMEMAIKFMLANPNLSSNRSQILLASSYSRLAASNNANHHYDKAIANQKKSIEICKKNHLPGLQSQERYLENYKRNKDSEKGVALDSDTTTGAVKDIQLPPQQ